MSKHCNTVRSYPFIVHYSAARLLQDGLDVTVFEAAVSRPCVFGVVLEADMRSHMRLHIK